MNNKKIIFSVIIPTYNSSSFLTKCLDSLEEQSFNKDLFEVIIIDDASSDNTIEVAKLFDSKLNLKIFKLTKNGGPGVARNKGIEESVGEWSLFIDSDDFVTSDYLDSIYEVIINDNNTEAIGFNWSREKLGKESREDFIVGRSDGNYLFDKKELLQNFLAARMDGSVIYTAIKSTLLKENNIRFYGGLHEDIDFIFKVYLIARKSFYLNKPLYLKKHREESIINNISIKHLEGYIRAWEEIGKTLNNEGKSIVDSMELSKNYKLGLIGVIASRAKEIRRHEKDSKKREELYEFLYNNTKDLISKKEVSEIFSLKKTSYCNIANMFLETMEQNFSLDKKVETVVDFLSNLEGKSWSCNDLAYSLFLRADEINTCCRRFFVNNERKGDVTILDIEDNKDQIVSSQAILSTKKELYHKINTGIENECDGCPFLEFKKWEPLNKLDVRYLSFEHHSVCNLKCSYCSDDYYGGKKAFYDVKETITNMINSGELSKCHTIVWGGGEPTIGQDFEEIVELLSTLLPNVKHRIVTNAVKRSPAVEKLLKEDKIQLTCSIDSGSDEVFEKVRGKNVLPKVLDNLVHYSSINSSAVTIKYLFTLGNGTLEDIKSFSNLVKDYRLSNCIFQISNDFKFEFIEEKVILNMILLFGFLKKIGCQSVFFDEIILQRIRNMDNSEILNVEKLNSSVGFNFIESFENYDSIVVWGVSPHTKNIMNKSIFFNNIDIEFFVDSNEKKQEEKFFGKDVLSPKVLANKKYPIFISAVQGYSSILKELISMGYEQDDIIDKLII